MMIVKKKQKIIIKTHSATNGKPNNNAKALIDGFPLSTRNSQNGEEYYTETYKSKNK